jgi:hypothetical protein
VRKIAPIVFCGSKSYCTKKLADLKKQGWVETKRKEWSDGRLTIIVEILEK